MTDFVLVHGAWHGAWCWRKVLPTLWAAGFTIVRVVAGDTRAMVRLTQRLVFSADMADGEPQGWYALRGDKRMTRGLFPTASAAFVHAELNGWEPQDRKVLNEQGLANKSNWMNLGGCSCHLGGAPCSSCTHPGNPTSAAEDEEQWEWQ